MDAPMSSSLGAIGPLLRKLDLLLAPEYPLRRSLKQAIELLKEDLEEVGAALVEQSMVDASSNKAKYWMDEVRELSYDVEDCIDDMIQSHTAAATTKVRPVNHFKVARLTIHRLPKMLKPSTRVAKIAEIRTLVREASERYERYQLDCGAMNPRFPFTGTHSPVPALYKAATNLVGVADSWRELTEWLTNQEKKQLQVLSVVGSVGIGKTSLIRALYRELKGQFECRAFIRVSRKPDMSKLIEEILSQVQGPNQISDGSVMQNSIDSVREHLQDKRYLIVIDELWDATPWDILSNAFPKGNNCSRIIITAQFEDVATKCSGYHSLAHFEMKPLVSKDSEKLFLHRVFGSEHHYPDQLKEVSCSITKACAGLPLAIITMAGLLASELDNTDLWNQLLQCFFPSLAILTLEEMLEKIVNLCYNSLPPYLKTCLLYLNIYPEGSTIWKVDLLKQWIAEGLVSPTEAKEGAAESYFYELVNRGMIQPEKINHNDEVLSFTVHHVVYDLLSHKSREEKFITAVDYSQTIAGFPMKVHRLSLHFSCATYASKPEGIRLSQVRSAAFFGLQRCMPSIIEFKHLRVLNLELWGDYDDCTSINLSGICRLFQLRYLKVESHIFVELPSEIRGLQFLETLEIDANVSDIPIDIACLPSLLHLSLRDGTKLPDGIGRITSLQTLQYFDLGNNSEDNVRSLGELINLNDLHLTCTEARSDEHLKRNLAALSSSLGRLANLRSLILAPGTMGMTMFVDHSDVMFSVPIFLQRLELLSPIFTFSKLPEWIAKLQMLRTLKCFVRELLQEDIDILAGLPLLTSLSLFVRQSTSEIVIFHSGAFLVLKYFKYRCDALCLVFEAKALPNLQRLKLGFNAHRGDQYANFISGIEYLFNLKKISLEIGAATGAEEYDRRVAESAFKAAIMHPPRFRNFLNIKRVDRIEEGKMLCLPIPARGARSKVAAAAVALIERWELPEAKHRLVFESQEDAEEYLAAAACLVGWRGPRAEAALQTAMARLKEEFRHHLICGARPHAADDLPASLISRIWHTVPSFDSSCLELDSSSSDHAGEGDDSVGPGDKKSFFSDETLPYLIPPETVGTLRDIADVMLHAGYAQELCQVYRDVRHDRLMECLTVFGVDKMSLEEVQPSKWRILAGETNEWIQALKVVVRLLAEERRICHQILAADVNIEEECFTEAAKGCVLHVLSLVDAIAMAKRPSEKLFRILDMYQALAEVLPELEALFSGETRDFIREEAEHVLERLGITVRGTIILFSSTLQGYASQRPQPRGEIHPLTRYVMNYVRLLTDYSSLLNNLLENFDTAMKAGADNKKMTPLGRCVLMLITHLHGKIEEKSKLLEDESLQNIFLMNNLLYIVQMVNDSELKTLVGDNSWIRKLHGQIRQYSTGYLRSSWTTKVLAWLRNDGLLQTTSSSGAHLAAPKDRLENFNLAFKELYRTQTSWRVEDPQLREELKVSILEKVLPAYRSFVGRYQGQLEGGGSSAKYIKYNPEDLENMISHLFEGRKPNA